MTGIIKAVCISEKKGTQKQMVEQISLQEGYGIIGDAHAGKWHRQVSLLSFDKIEAFKCRGAEVDFGAFGENIVASGIDFRSLPVGTRFQCGDVLLELTQIGKECHSHCTIYHQVGDCIMPREGVFAIVLSGGTIKPGDTITVMKPSEDRPFQVAVITMSDKGAEGKREDFSGPAIEERLGREGFQVVERLILPDDKERLVKELIRLSDMRQVDMILTTGGTGFAPRDITPEATLEVADRNAPGISEAIRADSIKYTPRAMLSRGVSVIRRQTLIINLPGSTKAVRESMDCIMGQLSHGLSLLRDVRQDCGR